jgi:predicted regulator of amino acid metabolism with ACT domain
VSFTQLTPENWDAREAAYRSELENRRVKFIATRRGWVVMMEDLVGTAAEILVVQNIARKFDKALWINKRKNILRAEVSIPELAKMSHRSERTVKRAIKTIEATGKCRVIRGKWDPKRNFINIYIAKGFNILGPKPFKTAV